MNSKDLLSKVKKLGISNQMPNDPGLFVLHQNVGHLIHMNIVPRNENNHVFCEINDEFIDPIP